MKTHRIHATRTQLRVHAAHQLPVQAHHNLPTPSTILLHGQIFPHNQDSNYDQHLHANMFSYQGTTFFFQWHCDVTVCSCTFDHDATPATAIMFGATVPPEFYCIPFFCLSYYIAIFLTKLCHFWCFLVSHRTNMHRSRIMGGHGTVHLMEPEKGRDAHP